MITTSEQAKDYLEHLRNTDPNKKRRIDQDDKWYFDEKKYVSNSMLKQFQKGGIRNYMCYLNGELKKSSKAFDIGSAFHCMVLEPEEFSNRYFIIDDEEICEEIGGKKPKMTKKYKEWYQNEIIPSADGLTILSREQMNNLDKMFASLSKIDEATSLIKACDLVENIYTNNFNGTNVKCKVDGIKFDNFVMDLKTTSSNVMEFEKSCRMFDYDQAAAFYCDIVDVKDYYFVVVETMYPYNVGVFKADDSFLERGRAKYEQGLKDLNYHLSNPDLDVNKKYISQTLY